jgi:hypothetical protein
MTSMQWHSGIAETTTAGSHGRNQVALLHDALHVPTANYSDHVAGPRSEGVVQAKHRNAWQGRASPSIARQCIADQRIASHSHHIASSLSSQLAMHR